MSEYVELFAVELFDGPLDGEFVGVHPSCMEPGTVLRCPEGDYVLNVRPSRRNPRGVIVGWYEFPKS